MKENFFFVFCFRKLVAEQAKGYNMFMMMIEKNDKQTNKQTNWSSNFKHTKQRERRKKEKKIYANRLFYFKTMNKTEKK